MPNGNQMPNPLAALASTARQFNEQTNNMVKSLGDSVTQTANQFLQATAQGLPALPGLPGAQSNPGNSNPGNSNPNNQAGQFPTPQQLLAQPLQAVSQAEDIILPKGFPRPAAQLAAAMRTQQRRTVTEERPAAERQPTAPPAAPARGLAERRGL